MCKTHTRLSLISPRWGLLRCLIKSFSFSEAEMCGTLRHTDRLCGVVSEARNLNSFGSGRRRVCARLIVMSRVQDGPVLENRIGCKCLKGTGDVGCSGRSVIYVVLKITGPLWGVSAEKVGLLSQH